LIKYFWVWPCFRFSFRVRFRFWFQSIPFKDNSGPVFPVGKCNRRDEVARRSRKRRCPDRCKLPKPSPTEKRNKHVRHVRQKTSKICDACKTCKTSKISRKAFSNWKEQKRNIGNSLKEKRFK